MTEKKTAKAKADEVVSVKRRRLSELYVLGEEVEIGGDEGAVLWIQKLSSTEDDEAARAARPYKTAISVIKRLPEDAPEKSFYYDQLDLPELDSIEKRLEYLVQPALDEFELTAEAQLADEEEWKKEDYLIGLNEAWSPGSEDGLYQRFVTDPEDEEARRVYQELQRFTEEFQARVDARKQDLIYELEDLEDEEINKRVVNRLIEDESNNKMYQEFRFQQLYRGTRDPEDHSKKYFESIDEIRSLPKEAYIELLAHWIGLNMDSIAGKD